MRVSINPQSQKLTKAERRRSITRLRSFMSTPGKIWVSTIQAFQEPGKESQPSLRELRRRIGRAWRGRGAVAEVRAQRDGRR